MMENQSPQPGDRISVTFEEFEEAPHVIGSLAAFGCTVTLSAPVDLVLISAEEHRRLGGINDGR